MKKHLIEKYAKPVPRYTSYPSAPHFHSGVTHLDYSEWLKSIDTGKPVSLYLHVPFCEELCWFCGCNTKITKQYAPIKKYVALLKREIEMVRRTLEGQVDVSHIHWGGGSPTLLKDDDFELLMQTLRSAFNVLPDAEIAVEIDPRTLSQSLVKAFGRAGVTRASLGVQDFSQDVQKAINRYQPFDMVKKAVDALRVEGIKAINFDLIYGLPHQTVGKVVETAKLAVALNPDRLSVFGYAHVPWMKTHMRLIKDETLPDIFDRYEQSQAIAETLKEGGYAHIGLDHFAKPGDSLVHAASNHKLRRNFQGYTTDTAEALIGLGVSSISGLPAGYSQNHTSMHQYAAAIEEGTFAISKGIALEPADIIDRRIIEQFMCNLEVDTLTLSRAGKLPFALLRPMEEDGLIKISDDKIEITPEGRPFMRHVCAAFDRYFGDNKARHSVAV
ncbi:oxygen-independent coproporphyrinogen III oxidase [Kordiimonas sp. SCSIO 12610]|uniref:oxygen-independent coproporphyrinogen III oxidase n=1 Tax=Kordiimonas sp. SCSIO 12610 TaxID=2829597 RepID=UPI00210BA500|nr:oxygen-independent coproporphyrinogen III oxidase [Kordiimonas sp. SCSIO 12610]UTW55695.1 oxygen-independent coproporphyrinogen III oxidase [Kordiimonas sp. SCSIO 12610]